MGAPQSIIAELEEAIQSGSQDKRVETLRRVTDLFLSGADRLNDSQIAVFDDVLGLLIKRIESKAMIELSARLAPVDNAPRKLFADSLGTTTSQSPNLYSLIQPG